MKEILYCTGTVKDGINFIITCYKQNNHINIDIVKK